MKKKVSILGFSQTRNKVSNLKFRKWNQEKKISVFNFSSFQIVKCGCKKKRRARSKTKNVHCGSFHSFVDIWNPVDDLMNLVFQPTTTTHLCRWKIKWPSLSDGQKKNNNNNSTNGKKSKWILEKKNWKGKENEFFTFRFFLLFLMINYVCVCVCVCVWRKKPGKLKFLDSKHIQRQQQQ